MAGKVRQILKKILVPIIRLFMKAAPQILIEAAISKKRSLIDYLPAHRKFIYKKYLGDISVYVSVR